jgi:hypothetical protein
VLATRAKAGACLRASRRGAGDGQCDPAICAFAGGFVAAKISRAWPRGAAIVIGCFVMLGVVGMILMVPGHPTWMAILGLVLPVPMALLGAHLARAKAIPSL